MAVRKRKTKSRVKVYKRRKTTACGRKKRARRKSFWDSLWSD